MDTITEAALIARIQRKLKKSGLRLRSPRSWSAISRYGYYYVEDLNNKKILFRHVDTDALAVHLGVLKTTETVGIDF